MYTQHLSPRLLGLSLLLAVMYMLLWYVISRRNKRLDRIELAWSGGFVLTAWMVAAVQPAIRTYMVAVMVTAWAVRLAVYLVQRGKKDKRSAGFMTYVRRAVLVWLVGLPIIANAAIALPGLRWLFTAGYAVWAIGFYIEYKSDSDLRRFKADKNNEGKVLGVGLWQYSRHPNYYGELLQWWGIGLIAAQTSFGWLGLAGPLLLTYLIYKVTGIPITEKQFAKNKDYQEYKKRTNPLLPWPTKAGA